MTATSASKGKRIQVPYTINDLKFKYRCKIFLTIFLVELSSYTLIWDNEPITYLSRNAFILDGTLNFKVTIFIRPINKNTISKGKNLSCPT